jgi:hypothetical protein
MIFSVLHANKIFYSGHPKKYFRLKNFGFFLRLTSIIYETNHSTATIFIGYSHASPIPRALLFSFNFFFYMDFMHSLTDGDNKIKICLKLNKSDYFHVLLQLLSKQPNQRFAAEICTKF